MCAHSVGGARSPLQCVALVSAARGMLDGHAHRAGCGQLGRYYTRRHAMYTSHTHTVQLCTVSCTVPKEVHCMQPLGTVQYRHWPLCGTAAADRTCRGVCRRARDATDGCSSVRLGLFTLFDARYSDYCTVVLYTTYSLVTDALTAVAVSYFCLYISIPAHTT